MSDEEQAKLSADHFSAIPNEYSQLKESDIKILTFSKDIIPQLQEVQVWDILCHLKTNKSTDRGISLQNCIKRWLLI